ncbi:MAG: hypothetical protein EP320_10480 [Rhodobacteraceae bacterium]|nr:MAG: hypothetical protein EP320_10480 [Paracoccaceae bacterium]
MLFEQQGENVVIETPADPFIAMQKAQDFEYACRRQRLDSLVQFPISLGFLKPQLCPDSLAWHPISVVRLRDALRPLRQRPAGPVQQCVHQAMPVQAKLMRAKLKAKLERHAVHVIRVYSGGIFKDLGISLVGGGRAGKVGHVGSPISNSLEMGPGAGSQKYIPSDIRPHANRNHPRLGHLDPQDNTGSPRHLGKPLHTNSTAPPEPPVSSDKHLNNGRFSPSNTWKNQNT